MKEVDKVNEQNYYVETVYVIGLIDNGCVIFFFGNKLFLETHEDNMKFVILFLTERAHVCLQK